MNRVMIIGGPGSGKTWLARELATRLALPVIAIDDLVHGPDGTVRAAGAIDADAKAAADRAAWIIEGGNSRTYAYRAVRADCLIYLTPPVLLRLLRVLRRNGLNWKLLAWTWRYDRVFGPRDEAIAATARVAIEVFRLHSPQAVFSFLETNAQPARPLRP